MRKPNSPIYKILIYLIKILIVSVLIQCANPKKRIVALRSDGTYKIYEDSEASTPPLGVKKFSLKGCPGYIRISNQVYFSLEGRCVENSAVSEGHILSGNQLTFGSSREKILTSYVAWDSKGVVYGFCSKERDYPNCHSYKIFTMGNQYFLYWLEFTSSPNQLNAILKNESWLKKADLAILDMNSPFPNVVIFKTNLFYDDYVY